MNRGKYIPELARVCNACYYVQPKYSLVANLNIVVRGTRCKRAPAGGLQTRAHVCGTKSYLYNHVREIQI
jgi:hypothetical protein